MKKINLLSLFILGSLFMIQMSQTSCTNDKLVDPDTISNEFCDTISVPVIYDNQIKPIIDNSCAFAGCHGSGAGIGDMTDYAKLSIFLNDNAFKKRVIDIMDMPEGDMLSASEFELVECWVLNDYPEN
ncbi:MAG: hypothetical protein AB8H03_10035 [Saprospiraceae bacterium]